jgi:CheY-like chemotaxis protein
LANEIEPQLIVILSDINMPGMDGLTLLDEVKQRFPDLPVMMITAYGDDEPPSRCREWRGRVHHEAGRFRPVEGAATPVTGRDGLNEPTGSKVNLCESNLADGGSGFNHRIYRVNPFLRRPKLVPDDDLLRHLIYQGACRQLCQALTVCPLTHSIIQSPCPNPDH